MTLDEAWKIASIIRHADHGCDTCVQDLCELLNDAGFGFRFQLGLHDVDKVPYPLHSDDPASPLFGHSPLVLVERIVTATVSELKPCPFCGAQPVAVPLTRDDWICSTAFCPLTIGRISSKAWNRRAPSEIERLAREWHAMYEILDGVGPESDGMVALKCGVTYDQERIAFDALARELGERS